MRANMAEPNFMTAILGLALSLALVLTFASLFRFFGRKDLNVHKKHAAHSRPTSRLGGLVVCLSILTVMVINNEA